MRPAGRGAARAQPRARAGGRLRGARRRAYTNLATGARPRAIRRRRPLPRVGIAYSERARPRLLDDLHDRPPGPRALDQGRWDAAAASAQDVLADPRVAPPSRIWPLVVIGRLRARRGDPDPWAPLDEARDAGRGRSASCSASPRSPRHAPRRTGWPESGRDRRRDRRRARPGARAPRCLRCRRAALWRRRAGIEEAARAEDDRRALSARAGGRSRARRRGLAPARLSLRGGAGPRPQRATRRRSARRSPSCSASALGPRPARVARALRERGARDVRQGPRTATRDNPAASPPASSRCSRCSQKGSATPRSRRASSCPSAPSRTTSRRSCASSRSAPGPGSGRGGAARTSSKDRHSCRCGCPPPGLPCPHGT